MDEIEPLLRYAPFLIPAVPAAMLFFYLSKVRKGLTSEEITLQKLESLLSDVAIHLPHNKFIKLKNEKVSVKVLDILQDHDSSVLLQVIQRKDKLKIQVGVLTQSQLVTCLGVFAALLVVYTFALNPGQPLLGILLLLVLVLALFAFIVIDYYEHRVRSDMQILVGHVSRTPQRAVI